MSSIEIENQKEYLSNSLKSEDCYELSLIYTAEKDLVNAFNWMLKAAEQGFADAQNALGNMYLYEKGVIQNRDKAYEWYSKAAAQGNSDSLENLGLMFFCKDWDTEEEKISHQKMSYDYFKKSADLGNAYAMYKMAQFYAEKYEGLGEWLEKNSQRSFYWYECAAKRGYAPAQSVLGKFYLDQLTNKENVENCLRWFFQAAKQGREQAKGELTELINRYGVYKKTLITWESIDKFTTFDEFLTFFNDVSFKK